MYEFTIIEPKWTDNDRCVIMERNGLGVVEIEIPKQAEKPLGYIWDLFVIPTARRKGLAKRLLQLAEGYIKERGMTYAVLDWDKRDTPLEIYHWYESCGYAETEFNRYKSRMEKLL